MDELETAVSPKKPKRRTHASRLKDQREYLRKDIAALESLVQTLLSHLERATEPGVTDADRVRFRHMVNEVRGALSDAPETETSTLKVA
jgi:hypothetical protein